MKYRIKDQSGTILGPHTLKEVQALFKRGLISGTESFEIYPRGVWKKALDFPELASIFKLQKSEGTFVRSLEDLLKEEKAQNFPEEFKGDVLLREEFIEEIEKHPPEISKTKIKEEPLSHDKTRVTPLTLNYLEELKKEELKRQEEVKSEKKKELENPPINYESDKTQVLDIRSLQKQLAQESKEAEAAYQAKELEISQKKKEFVSHNTIHESKKSAVKPKKHIKLFIYFIGMLFLGYVLFFPADDEIKKKALTIESPKIHFPVQFETKDENLSTKLYEEGIQELSKGKYLDLINASGKFRESLENNIGNRDSLAQLLKVYGELLGDSSELLKDANTIYKLTQISKSLVLNNPNALIGQLYLYYNLNKYQAGVRSVKNFLAVSKPTPDLFALYLKTAIKANDISLAKSIYSTLSEVNKTVNIYDALIDYHLLNEDYLRASNLLAEALDRFPANVLLLLRKCELLTYQENFTDLAHTVVEVSEARAEHRPSYYAKYLEYLGVVRVAQNRPEDAAKNFKDSLKIKESPRLRLKLAQLQVNGNEAGIDLILESKAMQLIKEAKEAMEHSQWEQVFSKTVQAVDLAPNYIPAKIFLSEIQIKKGMFGLAIKGLDKLSREYQDNPVIGLALFDAYVASYKFLQAKEYLGVIGQNDGVVEHPDFELKIANYYEKKGDYLVAQNWFKKAIQKNPLSDEAYYRLAQLYLNFRQYKLAKRFLSNAIDLDPTKVEYRTMYADIVYELEGVDTAIGYLRTLKEDFPNNPYIFGEIAIYYYKSGQLKDFEDTEKQLSKMAYPRKNLYEYLIRTSLLNNRPNDVIKYGRELVKIEPGDLKTRMTIGRVLYEQEKYSEALKEFGEVRDRLDTYPKLLYYISKIYLKIGNIEKALENAKREIESNPNLEDGYVLLGDIYIEQENWIEADNAFKKAQAINRNSFDAIMGLAFLQFKRNQLSQALSLYKKAKSLNESNPEVYKRLGDVYRNLGQGVDAIEAYRVFLKHVPDSPLRSQIESYIRTLE